MAHSVVCRHPSTIMVTDFTNPDLAVVLVSGVRGELSVHEVLCVPGSRVGVRSG